MKKQKEKRKATLIEALSAVLVLLVIFFFGSLADLSAPALMGNRPHVRVVFIGWRCGYTWKDLEEFSAEKVKAAAPANSVLIAVGFCWGRGCSPVRFPCSSTTACGGQRQVDSGFGIHSLRDLFNLYGNVLGICGYRRHHHDGNSHGDAERKHHQQWLAPATLAPFLATSCLRYLTRRFWHLLRQRMTSSTTSKNMSKTVVPGGLIGLVIYAVMGIKADAGAAGLPGKHPAAPRCAGRRVQMERHRPCCRWCFLIYGCIAKKPSTVIMMLSAVLALF